jgi:drug/metabolite transporter (DMT)-like permease
MAGARFLIVGLILWSISYARHNPRPTAKHWRNAALAGTLLMLGGNGLVTWAEQYVPSGPSALIAATSALWIVLITGRARQAWAGVILGALGVALLTSATNLTGALALIASSLAWALGTVVVRRADLPESTLQATAMEMLTGAIALLIVGLATGEPAPTSISRPSLIAFIYLVAIGSLGGYALYTYLLKHTTPARLGTYTYVTPVVAVTLGWTIAHDPITPRTIAATIAIVLSLAILSVRPRDG